ncbi:MAG TPA: P-type conjugative transfer ATPase TrbB [Bacillota bacterium]|jgi:P-type conjugative transfer ATPase TrbB|nr:P-type conjugative transfer ATPase TrbB [Bacillota bacterium]HOL09885.1 P-type conjugative transfer ATPase TrbB [Bacillota bacterium]HPO98662.1 P-type conjugative transfer ATPase TrbB [Bacillota bacterium]
MNSNMKKVETSYDRLMQMLATAVGPEIGRLLEDPKVVELMLNPDGKLWVEKLGEGRSDTNMTISPANAERVIYLIASSTGAVCNADNPILSAEFPGSGNRFQGLLPPVVTAPVFTIRKKALMVFTLDNYVEQQIMTPEQRQSIIDAVHQKKNILIVGGTGSGKTTLANAVLNEIAQVGDRIIIIEDTLELQCTAPDTVFLRSREHVSMNDLLKATMRLRPDRIVVGEVRGAEALTLLKAWNTGHPGGCATVHANSARGGLTRLEQLIQEAIPTPQKELIAEAVNLIIYIERYQHGRRIREVVAVDGIEDGNYLLRPV